MNANRAPLIALYDAALRRVDPHAMVTERLAVQDNSLIAAGDGDPVRIDLDRFREVRLIGVGKAGAAMGRGVEAVLGRPACRRRGGDQAGPRRERVAPCNALGGGTPAPGGAERGRRPGDCRRVPARRRRHAPDRGALRRRLGAADRARRGSDPGRQAGRHPPAAGGRRHHRRAELRAQAPVGAQGRPHGGADPSGHLAQPDPVRRGRRPARHHRFRHHRSRPHHLRGRRRHPAPLPAVGGRAGGGARPHRGGPDRCDRRHAQAGAPRLRRYPQPAARLRAGGRSRRGRCRPRRRLRHPRAVHPTYRRGAPRSPRCSTPWPATCAADASRCACPPASSPAARPRSR